MSPWKMYKAAAFVVERVQLECGLNAYRYTIIEAFSDVPDANDFELHTGRDEAVADVARMQRALLKAVDGDASRQPDNIVVMVAEIPIVEEAQLPPKTRRLGLPSWNMDWAIPGCSRGVSHSFPPAPVAQFIPIDLPFPAQPWDLF